MAGGGYGLRAVQISGAKSARAVERKVRSSLAGTLGTTSRAVSGAPGRCRAWSRRARPPRPRGALRSPACRCLPGGPDVAHRVGRRRRTARRSPRPSLTPAQRVALGRQPRDAEHGPHERIVRHQLLHGVGRLGPERLVADHGRRRRAPEPNGPATSKRSESGGAIARAAPAAGARPLVLEQPLEPVKPVLAAARWRRPTGPPAPG